MPSRPAFDWFERFEFFERPNVRTLRHSPVRTFRTFEFSKFPTFERSNVSNDRTFEGSNGSNVWNVRALLIYFGENGFLSTCLEGDGLSSLKLSWRRWPPTSLSKRNWVIYLSKEMAYFLIWKEMAFLLTKGEMRRPTYLSKMR